MCWKAQSEYYDNMLNHTTNDFLSDTLAAAWSKGDLTIRLVNKVHKCYWTYQNFEHCLSMNKEETNQSYKIWIVELGQLSIISIVN